MISGAGIVRETAYPFAQEQSCPVPDAGYEKRLKEVRDGSESFFLFPGKRISCDAKLVTTADG